MVGLGDRRIFVVAYDVVDDRKRAKLHDLLKSYGEPINRSVFECELTRGESASFSEEISRIIDSEEDIIAFYPLCKGCYTKRWRLGKSAPAVKQGPTIVA